MRSRWLRDASVLRIGRRPECPAGCVVPTDASPRSTVGGGLATSGT